MATVLERPLALPRSPSAPASFSIPQRRFREPVEIIDLAHNAPIDVDSFESPPRPAQRRRIDPEVIEILDSDDEGPVAGPSNSNTQASTSGSRSGTNSGRSSAGTQSPVFSGFRSGRRPLFSPSPPPFQSEPVPPVPPLPHRYSSFAAFPPSRPRPARNPAPSSSNLDANEASSSRVPAPIRPVSNTFVFDLSSSPPPPPNPRRVISIEDDLLPAPRARHNPPMGLGGALISSNNARVAAERMERQRRMERRIAGARVAPLVAGAGSNRSLPRPNRNNNAGFLARLAQLNPFRWGAEDEQPLNQIDYLALAQANRDDRTRNDRELALDLLLQDQEELGLGEHLLRFVGAGRGRWRGGIRGEGQEVAEEAYKQQYTHPAHAEPGFVFDFEPSEIVPASDTGKGKGKQVVIDVDALESSDGKNRVDALLVCARCLDPLFLRSEGVVDGGEEERKRRRLWGLRCGHILDGKCVEELWKPPIEAEAAPSTTNEDIQPKGKGKATVVPTADADEEDEDGHQSLFGPSDSDSDGAEALIPANPIRGRLRSAGAVLGVVTADGGRRRTGPPPRVPPPRPRVSRATIASRGRGRGKGKRARKAVIQDRFEWTCPVAGCGRVHVSEQVDGVWGPPPTEAGRGRKEGDAGRGPIGMFL
ncbi:hypothetical protein C8F01DRAFT_1154334 [Mycena amicta]|nr:hypothetical protein C8F01DRAFT_1154334 [Mycena amicta]